MLVQAWTENALLLIGVLPELCLDAVSLGAGDPALPVKA